MISTNVHLRRDVNLRSIVFHDGRPFTSVRIEDALGNDVTLFVHPDSADVACALADALRAAALAYLPSEQPQQQPEPVAAEV